MERTGLRSPFVRAELLEAQGLLALAAGDADAAIRWHGQALAERMQHLGPDHFEVGKSLHNLGNAHALRGEPVLAIGMLRRALRVYGRLLGPWHPKLAKTWFDLSDAWVEVGAIDDAARALERARAIYEHTQGPEAPGLAGLHLSLARVDLLRAPPKVGSALVHLQRARELQRDDPNLGPSHPDRATLLQLEGMLVIIATSPQVDYGRALEAYSQATEILRRHDPRSPAVLEATLKEIEVLYGLGDHAVLAARVASEGPPLATFLATLDPSTRGRVAWWVGFASVEAGRPEQAARYIEIATDAYRALGDQGSVDELLELARRADRPTTITRRGPTP
jgi:tetratricopeptide (TPR) repeat protein